MSIERKSVVLMFPKLGKISMILFSVLLIVMGIRAYYIFGYIFKPNVARDTILFIPTGHEYQQVENLILNQEIVKSKNAFQWVVRRKKYKESVRPGRYFLKKGMNTNELVNLLRSGSQSPVRVTFNNVRTSEELAGKIAPYFESDSAAFMAVFNDPNLLAQYNFDKTTFLALPIPNTYEFYWNTTPEKFIERMYDEYNKYWNEERKSKAGQLGLSPLEVSILASIVQEETNKNDEKATIAGVYLNRLKRGMPLQADPTVKFAWGDFSVRRITLAMLEIDSPYNTYTISGLPPGPICFPEISSLEGVLNAQKHQYLYFCAHENLSGQHRFARTLSEHNANAARYHSALNKQRIFK